VSTDPVAIGHQLPLWLKLLYTAYVAVVVPVYWYYYGPTNFLYFCDVALLMAVPAVWLESPLLASSALLGIFLVQMLWVVDFLGLLFGWPVTGMTAYMFDANKPFFLRALSFFHFWLPFFLLGVTWRLGYDRRAFWVWTVLAWGLMLVCYYLMPPPSPSAAGSDQPVNINYVYGFSDTEPQQWIANPNLYFVLMMVVLPLGILLPSHLAFLYLLPPAAVPAGAD
jgi:hypothetical protein